MNPRALVVHAQCVTNRALVHAQCVALRGGGCWHTYPAMLRNHRSGTPLHGRNNERAAERAERRAHNQGAQRTRAKRAAAWTHHTRPPSHRVKSQPPSHRASQESPSQAQDQDQDQAHSPSPVAALRLVLPAAPARSGKKHPAHKRAFSISIRNCQGRRSSRESCYNYNRLSGPPASRPHAPGHRCRHCRRHRLRHSPPPLPKPTNPRTHQPRTPAGTTTPGIPPAANPPTAE